jgi:hypothetical protein
MSEGGSRVDMGKELVSNNTLKSLFYILSNYAALQSLYIHICGNYFSSLNFTIPFYAKRYCWEISG